MAATFSGRRRPLESKPPADTRFLRGGLPQRVPHGQYTRIEFSDVTGIFDLGDAEIGIRGARREWTFRAPSAERAALFVRNLRALWQRHVRATRRLHARQK